MNILRLSYSQYPYDVILDENIINITHNRYIIQVFCSTIQTTVYQNNNLFTLILKDDS